MKLSLQWRHNKHDGVSNHQPRDCLLNHLFRRRSKKTSKLRVTALCAGNSPVTGEFPAQRASNAENVSIWWRHHGGYNNLSMVAIASVSLVTSMVYKKGRHLSFPRYVRDLSIQKRETWTNWQATYSNAFSRKNILIFYPSGPGWYNISHLYWTT